MMGGMGMTGGPFPPSSLPISTTQAIEILSSSGRRLITWTVWVLDEVEAYTQNYYGQLKERATGRGAIQVLVDRYTGRAMPGMGPNMTWNNKYGMMGGGIMERPRSSRSTAPATGSSRMCTAGGDLVCPIAPRSGRLVRTRARQMCLPGLFRHIPAGAWEPPALPCPSLPAARPDRTPSHPCGDSSEGLV